MNNIDNSSKFLKLINDSNICDVCNNHNSCLSKNRVCQKTDCNINSCCGEYRMILLECNDLFFQKSSIYQIDEMYFCKECSNNRLTKIYKNLYYINFDFDF